jgi:hypothetical protein
MMSSGILRCVALVRADVSEELSAFFIRVTRIGELGTTLPATRNRRTPRSVHRLLDKRTFCVNVLKEALKLKLIKVYVTFILDF